MQEGSDSVHFIPADIKYDGQANVLAFFETLVKPDASGNCRRLKKHGIK